jgi:hypothetical protein
MMKKAYQRTRYLQSMFGFACAVLVASCTNDVGSGTMGTMDPSGPDAAVPDLDPTGNWNLSYDFAAGCGQPETMATGTFTVTRAPNGFAVTAAGATTTGTLLCKADSCKLSGMIAWSDTSSQFQQNVNITLDAHDAIAGNGTESVVTGTTACSVTFTVQGTRT